MIKLRKQTDDRTFIDSAIYKDIEIFRHMLYFGYNEPNQPESFKDVKSYFFDYFGYNADENYYDYNDKSFEFENTVQLKDSFAFFYTRRILKQNDFPYYFQIFSVLDKKDYKSGKDICSSFGYFEYLYERLKELGEFDGLEEFEKLEKLEAFIEPVTDKLKSKLNKGSELAESGSIIVKGKSPRKYKLNIDICEGFSDKEIIKFLKALDYAIKKNNFTSFASTYKKLAMCLNDIDNVSCGVDIERQLFHPILDELLVWEIVSAITENRNIKIQKNRKQNEIIHAAPLKIVYDNLYGRTYLFAYEYKTEKITVFRVDRLYKIEQGSKTENVSLIDEKRKWINEKLKTAWLVAYDEEKETTEHVVLRFKNTPAIRARVENEGRHGSITKIEKNYFTYEIDVNDCVEMTNWVLNFGAGCKAEAPQKLVDRIIEHLRGMVDEA